MVEDIIFSNLDSRINLELVQLEDASEIYKERCMCNVCMSHCFLWSPTFTYFESMCHKSEKLAVSDRETNANFHP